GLANGTALRERARDSALAGRAPRSEVRSLSRAQIAPAARSRANPDARFRGNGDNCLENGSGGDAPVSGKHAPFRAGREPWRGGKPDQSPRVDDARFGS